MKTIDQRADERPKWDVTRDQQTIPTVGKVWISYRYLLVPILRLLREAETDDHTSEDVVTLSTSLSTWHMNMLQRDCEVEKSKKRSSNCGGSVLLIQIHPSIRPIANPNPCPDVRSRCGESEDGGAGRGRAGSAMARSGLVGAPVRWVRSKAD
jgi:hypothetical protein